MHDFLHEASPLQLLAPEQKDTGPLYLTASEGCPQSSEWVDSGQGMCLSLQWAQTTDLHTAQDTCQAMGAHLPILTSAAENDVVAGFQGGCRAWVNLRRERPTGRWDWDLPFQKWGHKEEAGGAEEKEGGEEAYDCVRIDGKAGNWTVLHGCATSKEGAFVCQKPAEECMRRTKEGEEVVEGGWVVAGQWGYSRHWHLPKIPGSWRAIVMKCRLQGGWVASPANAAEFEVIRRVMGSHGGLLGVYRLRGHGGVGMWRRDLWEGPPIKGQAATGKRGCSTDT